MTVTDIWSFLTSSNLPPVVVMLLGGAGLWLDRRKHRADMNRMKSENKATEAGALQGMQSVYDKFVNDVGVQISGLKQQITDLQTENRELKDKIRLLEKKLKEYMQ